MDFAGSLLQFRKALTNAQLPALKAARIGTGHLPARGGAHASALCCVQIEM
jgi:hypothetical protein